MRKTFYSLLAVIAICFTACQSGTGGKSVKTTEKGLKYSLHESNSGPKAKLGDFLTLNIKYTTPNDSALFSTFENPKPITMEFQKNLFNGVINEGIELMSAGDSATFFLPAEKVYRGNFPAFVKDPNDEFKYVVKLFKIQSKEEIQSEKKNNEKKSRMKNDQDLAQYLQKNNIRAQKLDNGLYYVVDELGSGAHPKPGQTVEVHYTGTLLDGTKFDSSKDRNKTFKFPLGQGRVIQGWDSGIPLFKKGGKGTLYIPSHLGYGERGAGAKIPGGAVLKFDIELIDFE